MATALKDEYKWALRSITGTNLVIFYAAVQTDSILQTDWLRLVTELGKSLPAGILLAAVSILNAQLSWRAKARLLFLRWHNPLPGRVAFTDLAHTDERIDLDQLEHAYGPLPTEHAAQNKLWYKLYQSVEDTPSVRYVNREWLFARDWACLAVLALIVLGPIGFFQIPSVETAFFYVFLMLNQIVFVGRAARVNARRLVTTVLALKSTDK